MRALGVSAIVVVGCGVCCGAAPAAPPAPAWSLNLSSNPTNISALEGGHLTLLLGNRGGRATDGSEVTVTDTLPAGLTPTETVVRGPVSCTISGQAVTCTIAGTSFAALDSSTVSIGISFAAAPSFSGATDTATVTGGGADPATASVPLLVGSGNAPFAISAFDFSTTDAAGAIDTQAGDHPDLLTVGFTVNTKPFEAGYHEQMPAESIKDVVVDLPVGVVGNPQVLPTCTSEEFIQGDGACPSSSVDLGSVNVLFNGGGTAPTWTNSTWEEDPEDGPLQNLQADGGFPAQFAFGYSNVLVASYASVVHTPAGYQLRTSASGINRAFGGPFGVRLSIFGHPGGSEPTSLSGAPFLTNPSDCASSGATATVHIDSWRNPAPVPLKPDGSPNFSAVSFEEPQWQNKTVTLPAVRGCEKLRFDPTIALAPDNAQAGAPAGLAVDLKVPQATDSTGLATPPLKDATITLPQGMVVNPSSANGLQACSAAQIAVDSTEPASCPAASQLATVEVDTPLLAAPLHGQLFLGTPECDPCTNADAESGRLLRGYIQAEDLSRGVVLKLPGTIAVNPATGQVSATFDQNPQLPFSDLHVTFKSGPRAALSNPAECGTYTATSDLKAWSTPYTPDAQPTSSFTVDEGCGAHGFAPSFSSGTTNAQAGAYSPFTLSLARTDQEQDLRGVAETLPPGLLAKLAGVPLCGDAEANAGACPAGSRIGSVTVGAGAGPTPYYVTGDIYLTGPYNGGPFGVVVVVPAVAGPFNLGTVVVRGSIRIDPSTAQASVVTDAVPTILDGIPLQVRSVLVSIDRPGFVFNPTNCVARSIGATLTSAQAATATLSAPFEVANCATLPFKPRLSAATAGRASKAAGASLTVDVTSKGGPQSGGGEANIRSVKVDLPKQLPSRLTTLQKACLAATFATNPASCPRESDVGTAVAATPVLAHTLSGPAYLVSYGGGKFPDLEIVLQGEGVTLILDGNTAIKKSITSSTFKTIPDAPISSFELKLPAGKYSVLATNLPQSARYNLCGQALTMPTAITGQNGAVVKQSTKITVTGCRKVKKTAKHKPSKAKRK